MADFKAIKIGKSYRLYFNPGNINNGVLHVRAIVDGAWVVVRQWARRKGRWIYRVEHLGFLEGCYRDGSLKAR